MDINDPKNARSAHERAWLVPVAACLIAITASFLFWHTKTGAVRNTNVGSRYATVEALVNWGTYDIDKTRYVNTIDKVKLNGHFLSSKPPLLPTTTAGAYWLFRQVTGDDIRTQEYNVVLFCNFVMVGLPHLLLLVFFFRFLSMTLKKPEAIIIALAGMCFCYLGLGYAIELNNHSVAAAVAFISFYYAYRIRHSKDARTKHWILAGLLAGCLPGLDVPSTFISGCIGLYLLTFDKKKTLTLFLPAMIPGIAAHFIMTYIASGSVVPVYLRKEAYDYPGSYWRKPRGIDALDEPKIYYGFNVLFGHHGVFSITPPFIFAAIAVVDCLRKKERYLETLMVSAIFLVLVTFYIFYTNNYGGSCVGMRWLIVMMPFLWLYFGIFLERYTLSKWVWALVFVSFGIAQYHVDDAIRSPWHDGRLHQVFKRFESKLWFNK